MTGPAPKRILYIHHGKGLGGSPLSLLYLIRELDRARYEPVVLCLHKTSAVDLFRRAGVETHVSRGIRSFDHSTLVWYNVRRFWWLPWRLVAFLPSVLITRKWVKQLAPDLVHLNSMQLSPSAIGAHLADVPVVWHIREQMSTGYFGLRRWALRWAIARFGDRVIAICHNDANQVIQNSKVRVVYDFANLSEFDRSLVPGDLRRDLKIGHDKRLVAMLGGVNPAKGTWEFVQALPQVLASCPKAHFVVLGHYPGFRGNRGLKAALVRTLYRYQRRLERFIRDRGLEEHVTFTGPRLDVPQVMADAELIVFPSTVPHFARPLLEAGAMAKPVVASDLGGPREIVVREQTGLLVPPSDPSALSRAIVRILQDGALAKRMGEAGYARTKRMFTAQVNARQTMDVYEELFAADSSG
jgi:glycosyltransferase involved in cell wall biosynthesis